MENKIIKRGNRYILDSFMQLGKYYIFKQREINYEKQAKWQGYELSHCPICLHNQFDGKLNKKGYRNRICMTSDCGKFVCYECRNSFSFADIKNLNSSIYQLLCNLINHLNIKSVINDKQVQTIIKMIRERQTVKASKGNHIDHIIPLYILVTAYFNDKQELMDNIINGKNEKEFELLCYSLFNSEDNLCELSAKNNLMKSSLMLDSESLEKLLSFEKFGKHLYYLIYIKDQYGLDFSNVSNKKMEFKS